MKILPNSEESEKALIGSILISPNIISAIDLKKEEFYTDILWRLYESIKHIHYKWVKIDPVTISDYLKKKWILDKIGGQTFLVELMETAYNTSHYTTYVEIIKEKASRRKMIEYWREMANIWFNETCEVSESVWKIKDMYELSVKQNTKNWYDIIHLTTVFEEDRDKYHDKGSFGEASPFPIIDNYTWGIKEWFVYMIVAYSNVWKSNFSYAFVVDMLKKGKKVILFSLEVSHNKLFRHIIRAYYKKTEKEIMDKEFYFDMWDFENLIIYDNVYNLHEIESITRYHKPNSIFIDFVQNIKCEWNEYERMWRVAMDLQLLAIDMNIVIFNISQANNDWRFTTANKIQPRGSWALFQSSDVIFWLSREDWLLQLHLIKVKDWIADIWFLVNPDFARLDFKVTEWEERINKYELNI